MKIRPVGTELLHVDGRTDGYVGRDDEADSRFSQFARDPKNILKCASLFKY